MRDAQRICSIRSKSFFSAVSGVRSRRGRLDRRCGKRRNGHGINHEQKRTITKRRRRHPARRRNLGTSPRIRSDAPYWRRHLGTAKGPDRGASSSAPCVPSWSRLAKKNLLLRRRVRSGTNKTCERASIARTYGRQVCGFGNQLANNCRQAQNLPPEHGVHCPR